MLDLRIDKALFFNINRASILFSYKGRLSPTIKEKMTDDLYDHLKSLGFRLDNSNNRQFSKNLQSTLVLNSVSSRDVLVKESGDTVLVSGPIFHKTIETKFFKLIFL